MHGTITRPLHPACRPRNDGGAWQRRSCGIAPQRVMNHARMHCTAHARQARVLPSPSTPLSFHPYAHGMQTCRHAAMQTCVMPWPKSHTSPCTPHPSPGANTDSAGSRRHRSSRAQPLATGRAPWGNQPRMRHPHAVCSGLAYIAPSHNTRPLPLWHHHAGSCRQPPPLAAAAFSPWQPAASPEAASRVVPPGGFSYGFSHQHPPAAAAAGAGAGCAAACPRCRAPWAIAGRGIGAPARAPANHSAALCPPLEPP